MLLWIEGFDNFGTSNGAAPSPVGVVARKYPLVGYENLMDVEAGRLGGHALQLVYDSTCYLSPGPLTINATMIVGCALKWGAWVANTNRFLAFYDGTTLGMNLHITAAGEIAIYLGTSLIATTSGAGIATGAWFYVEFKVVCNASGSYELRINGVNKLSNGSVNTKAGTHDYHTTFRLTGTSTTDAQDAHFDDLFCLDGSGAFNNTFLGNMRVVTMRPDEAGASTQFTPDSGDNYARVNEVVCGDDTNYVEDATSGHKDLYGYAALAGISPAAAIKGIQINTDCRETDATSFSLITVCKSGATESDDAAQAIGSTNYVTRKRILETDPDTAAAWTKDSLDVVQCGIKVG